MRERGREREREGESYRDRLDRLDEFLSNEHFQSLVELRPLKFHLVAEVSDPNTRVLRLCDSLVEGVFLLVQPADSEGVQGWGRKGESENEGQRWREERVRVQEREREREKWES